MMIPCFFKRSIYFGMIFYFSPKELRYLDRFSQFSLIAAKEAVLDSNLNKKLLNNTKTAVIKRDIC